MNTLLIVEDEKMIRLGIKAIIQRAPIKIKNIIECKNGEEALEILKSNEIDVMFTDIRMPKMDGITLVSEMNKLPSKPLTVVVSGYDDFSYAVDMLRHGVKEYLLKPVEREQVYGILKRLDEEIEKNKIRHENEINISTQVLKSLILDINTSKPDLDAIIYQYKDIFFKDSFVTICTKPMNSMETLDDMVHIKDLKENSIFIMREDKKEDIISKNFYKHCVGISNPHIGLMQLKQSYNEAFLARGFAFAEGKIVYFKNIFNHDKKEKQDIEKQLDMIVQLIGTSNSSEAKKVLGQVFMLLKDGKLNPLDFESNMEQLIGKIASTYRALLPIENELMAFRNIWAYENGYEYYIEFCNWIDGFCNRLIEEFEDYENKQKIMKAVRYTEENFNKNLNMAVVSNHVSMNYSLFSYLFKQYTGNNFVSFLQKLRIEESKKLLKNTDMKIMEISVRSGFQNEKNFMKLFKTICGVSPSEFRRNSRIILK